MDEIKIITLTENQLSLLIESLGELYNKYNDARNMVFKPEDILLNSNKLIHIDMLSKYLRCINDSN